MGPLVGFALGEGAREAWEGLLGLQAREARADAVVGAVAEREVRRRVAGEVEAGRVRREIPARFAVGASESPEDRVPRYRLATVGISPYLRRLRESVGHALLHVPSVAVLVWDGEGRLLLVRDAESGRWQTLGGAIDPDESPRAAALRETLEEAGVTVALDGIRDVLGGPQFRLRYRNGDLVSYVPTVFDAHVVAGEPRADGEETLEVAWFTPHALAEAALTEFTHSLFEAVGVAVGVGVGRGDWVRR